jgi:hypothetical protein
MSIFPKVSAPTTPKTANVKQISTLYAAILTIFVVAQLFTFEDFITLIQSYSLSGGLTFAYFLSSFIVVIEIFALPFLLRMRVSPLFRSMSMVCGWLAAALWLKLGLWLVFTDNTVNNVGFLGTVVQLTPGWWNVLFSLALGILAVWASWGMWPKLPKFKK